MIRLVALCLLVLALLSGAEDKSKTIPAFNFDREGPRNATDKAEAQAAADELLIWANLNRMRAIGAAVKCKADRAKLAELQAIKKLPKSEMEFNQRMIDSLTLEIAKCDALAKEHAALAPAQRAQVEKLLTWAEIDHDPVMPYTLPARCHIDPKTLSEKVRSLDTDRDLIPDAKKAPQAQAQELVASAAEDERQLLVLSTELFGYTCHPGNGVSPCPDFGPAWRMGTPEMAAQKERMGVLDKRTNYLAWIAEEKRRQAKALVPDIFRANTRP